jgi:hypothetical protein
VAVVALVLWARRQRELRGRRKRWHPEGDATAMKELAPTDGDNDGPYFMSYDAAHHIAYASEFQSGHWRMVTE